MTEKEYVELGPGSVFKTTEKAILVVLHSDGKKHWIPRSLLSKTESGETQKKEDMDKLEKFSVALWFAKNEGLKVEHSKKVGSVRHIRYDRYSRNRGGGQSDRTFSNWAGNRR